MRVCHNCKRGPVPFPSNEGDGTIGYDCYWMVIPKNSPDDPSHLMSSGEFVFAMSPDIDPPDDEENDFWCLNCFVAAFGGDEHEL